MRRAALIRNVERTYGEWSIYYMPPTVRIYPGGDGFGEPFGARLLFEYVYEEPKSDGGNGDGGGA